MVSVWDEGKNTVDEKTVVEAKEPEFRSPRFGDQTESKSLQMHEGANNLT